MSGSRDGTVRICDLATGSPIGDPLTGHTDAVSSVAVTADSIRIISGSSDRTVRIWDLATGAPIGDPLTGHTDTVVSVAVTPDGTRTISGSFDSTARICDLCTGAPIVQVDATTTEACAGSTIGEHRGSRTFR